MDIRHSVHLLTVAIAAIIALLFLVAAYTLTISAGPASEAGVGTAASTVPATPVDPAFALGKKVWRKVGCGSCHDKSMTSDNVGPALRGVTARWSDYPTEDLYAWIRNNGKLRAAGHPRAVAVYNEWNKKTMNTYPALTDEEIAGLLAYIEGK